MATQMMYPPPDNTVRNVIIILGLAALVWFVILPMLKSPAAKAVAAVADAKAACDKAMKSGLPADMSSAQTSINAAMALIASAAVEEKAKGTTVPPPELVQAEKDLMALACRTAIVTSNGVVFPPAVAVPTVTSSGSSGAAGSSGSAGQDAKGVWSEWDVGTPAGVQQLCPSGMAVRKIYSADYTALEGPACTWDATSAANNVLLGKSGSFAFDQGINGVIGNDPCPGFHKALTVKYRCA